MRSCAASSRRTATGSTRRRSSSRRCARRRRGTPRSSGCSGGRDWRAEHARVRARGRADRAAERGDEHLAQVGTGEAAVLEPVEARRLHEADPAAHRDAERHRRRLAVGRHRQVVEQPGDHRAADLLDDVGDGRVAADPGAQHGRVAARVGLDVLEVALERGREALARLERRVGLGERLHLVGGRADDGDVEVALAREVVIEQALRDAGRRGDVVDRDLVERALAEDVDAERDELLAASVGAQTGAAGGGHARRSLACVRTPSRGSASPSAHATSASQTATTAARTAYATASSHPGPPVASRCRRNVSEVRTPDRAPAGTSAREACGDGGRYTGMPMRCEPFARRTIDFQLPPTGTGRSATKRPGPAGRKWAICRVRPGVRPCHESTSNHSAPRFARDGSSVTARSTAPGPAARGTIAARVPSPPVRGRGIASATRTAAPAVATAATGIASSDARSLPSSASDWLIRAPAIAPATPASSASGSAAPTIEPGHGCAIRTWLQPYSAAKPTVPMPRPAASAKASGRRANASAASSTIGPGAPYSGKRGVVYPATRPTNSASAARITRNMPSARNAPHGP